jgi:aspartate kinase
MTKIVMKFGGTSVGTGENIRHAADLVSQYAKNDCRVAVVVSALAGVTNKLLDVAGQAKKSDEKHIETFTKELLQKHLEAISTAIGSKKIQKEVTLIIEETIAELEKVLTGICYVGELTPKSKDYVVSFGERLSAPIVWGAIQDHKLETQCFTGKEAGIVIQTLAMRTHL